VRITLCAILLFLFLLVSSESFSQNYTNKDIEILKSQQKSTPTYKPPVVNKKRTDTAKSSQKGATTAGKSSSPAKSTRSGKAPDGINYSSPDGAIKIEVRTNKTATSKKSAVTSKSSSGRGAAPRAAKKEPRNTADIAELSDIKVITRMLPYEEWKNEYSDYFYRHYNDDSLALTPSIIVIRSTSSRSADDTINLFRRGSLYDEGNEGPLFGHLSCHYVLGRHGEIIQTLPLNVRSRGAYGVNHKAVTIELVGMSNQEIFNNQLQKDSLYGLLTSLMKQFQIPLSRVYGHYEVAQGKLTVPDYTEFDDSDYPAYYSPDKMCYDPGEIYMQQLRANFSRQTSRGQ